MFDFPKIERSPNFKYKQNLLKQVIVQVGFPKTDIVGSKIEEIKSLLEEGFPTNNITEINGLNIDSALAYEFKTQDKTKTFAISKTAATYIIDGSVYSNFENAVSEIKALAYPVLKLCELNEFERVGIRKINLMNTNIDKTLTPAIITANTFNIALANPHLGFPNPSLIDNTMGNFNLRKDNYHLILNYGIRAKETDQKKETAYDILLDIDLFAYPIKIKFEDIEKHWQLINEEIFNVFHWGINKNILNNIRS